MLNVKKAEQGKMGPAFLVSSQNRIIQHCLCRNWRFFLKDTLNYCIILYFFHWEIKTGNDTLVH